MRIAQALRRIAHGDEELGERAHRHERYAAVEIDDARRWREGERFTHRAFRYALGIERQHALLHGRIHRDRAQHRARQHGIGEVLARGHR